MNHQRIKELFDKLNKNQCTEAEIAELNDWYHSLKVGDAGMQSWLNEAGGEDELGKQLFERFNEKTQYETPVRRINYAYRIAAAVLVFIAIGGIFYKTLLKHPKEQPVSIAKHKVKPITPGRNTATLTLADGSEVLLDDVNAGQHIAQSGLTIQKTAEGKLLYTVAAGQAENATGYNTISTPRAGQYEVALPDGTHVWLNAASSLKYPLHFNNGQRNVELNGEAYFEVAHNKAMPFKVKTATQTVTVLGTHFNIKGYADDDAISTTLLEGSVRINDSRLNKSAMLVPGKQAVVSENKTEIALKDADTDQVMAWKNGYFIFENEDIRNIMKLISRWYDIDVEYKLNKPERFGGTFSRSTDLTELLKNIETLGSVKFKIKERRVIVSN